jgi:tricorn protease
LTSGDFYSTRPVWSPDGKQVAFASKRHGNLDLFLMSASGGQVKRLTDHSSDDVPYAFSRDGQQIYFSSSRLGGTNSVLAGTYLLSDQLYEIPAQGGRTRLVLETPALEIAVSPDGNGLLYENRPIYENEWRKGAVSDGTRDIWYYDLKKGSHRKLTDWRGEDRNAVWAADGKAFSFLSERSGSFNVWRQPMSDGATAEQVTLHTGQPVRQLSIAGDGTMVYSFEGEIWKKSPTGEQSQRIPIRISQASLVQGTFSANANEFVSELAVSPNGTEIAVIARGEVFVVSTVNGRTRRITSTPQFEKSVSFGPDGRTLLYSSERDGDSDVFEASVAANHPASFTAAGPIEEKKIVDTRGDVLFPAYSPDGTQIAYLDNRNSIRILNRKDGKTITPLPEGSIYSYQDGDMTFAWSPDGRWLTATTGSIVRSTEVVLLDATGKLAPMDISQSGYRDSDPQFTADGKAIVWTTDRNGLRQADDNAAQFDFYMAHLTQEGFDAFQLAANGVESAVEKTPEGATKEKGKKGTVSGATSWQPQIQGIKHRTTRLTPFSILPVFSHVSADNQYLVFVALEEPGRAVGYRLNLRNNHLDQLFVKPLTALQFAMDGKGENLYALSPSGIERISLTGGSGEVIPFHADIAYDPRGEVEYLFQYFWRLTKLKFYQADMHGVNWEEVRKDYVRYLPHIHTWEDFADLMGEMAGQLNASHMGCYYSPTPRLADRTASLGVYEDPSHKGEGLRVAEVLVGGPCDRADGRVKAGTVILAVDGNPVKTDMNIDSLLNHKEGIPVELTVRTGDGASPTTLVVTPISMDTTRALANGRWIERRKKMAETLSEGRVGYVYIPSMDAMSYQTTFGEIFGELWKKEAVVIDVRFNRGGNLHDQLIALFTGDVFAGFTSREGLLVGRIPVNRWAKPSALLVNAGSYSDGSIFPHLYKRQQIGPVVGARVPGTGTAVWWMTTLNNHIKYGIPQLGAKDFTTGWIENQETVPDVLSYNDPDAIEEGRDPQLEVAVKQLLTNLNGK